MKNWGDIVAHSELLAAQAIKQSFDEGELADVEEGLAQLIDTMARSEKRALQSQLIHLIMHVVKWHIQPDKRSRSWALTIHNARFEIAGLQKVTPLLNDHFIQGIWSESWLEALDEAEIETGIPTNEVKLTWEDVFDKQYML